VRRIDVSIDRATGVIAGSAQLYWHFGEP